MIYVSSSCLAGDRIDTVVEALAEEGFRSIELSGGTNDFPSLEARLIELQGRYGLKYRCHNYFPPPPTPFVFNLASQDEDIFRNSLKHAERNIALSRCLGADRVSFHAGFCLDVSTAQLGRKIDAKTLVDRDRVLERFCEGVRCLQTDTEALDFYLENNVFSADNKASFNGQNPFLLTSYEDFIELRQLIDFKLLLDVGHLKVSCQSLGIDFKEQFKKMMAVTDYLHISDNDSLRDANQGLQKGSLLFDLLGNEDLRGKTVTLEVYGGMAALKQSRQLLEELLV